MARGTEIIMYPRIIYEDLSDNLNGRWWVSYRFQMHHPIVLLQLPTLRNL